jgi:hypothetical protein
MARIVMVLSVFFLFNNTSYGQYSSKEIYEEAFLKISLLLQTKDPTCFKKGVFITENVYLNNSITYDEFEDEIQTLVNLAWLRVKNNRHLQYKMEDSLNLIKNLAIFNLISDTTRLSSIMGKDLIVYPCRYNFQDPQGDKDWTSTFVISLLTTNEGNCRSLPYLYKILADELGATCWLSFAPYHIYIKNRCKQTGWYNTELSSGQFPVDAWITASGYISMDAIRSGIYMDTLSNKQALANCMLDLAKGYERKTHNYTDSFIVRCCDLVLKYHPNNINAIVYKAEVLKKIYQISKNSGAELAVSLYPSMEALYLKAMDLGYKEMPERMYQEWIQSLSDQKEKYSDRNHIHTGH